MKNNKFRKAFDNIDYTDEFRQKMRDKLSQPAEAVSKTSDEDYSQRVEGVEIIRRSSITRYVRPVAACLAAVVGIGAIGIAMRGAFNSDEEPLASRLDDNKETTEIATELASVPTLDMFISSKIPYTELSGKTDDELHEIGMRYFEAACELHLVNGGTSIALNCDYTKSFDDETDMNFYLVQYDKVSSISDAENLYRSVFSETWEFEEGFFREQDGSLYYSCDNAAYDNVYYEGWEFHFVEAADEKITYRVDAFFNDGVAGRNIQTVPCEFSLIPEDGVWKVQSFIYPAGIPMYGGEDGGVDCELPENESSEYEGVTTEAVTENSQSAANGELNPEDFIGTWRIDGDEYGLELRIISIEENMITFDLSHSGIFKTETITVELEADGEMTYFSTYNDYVTDFEIEGGFILQEDETVYLYVKTASSIEEKTASSIEEINGDRVTFDTRIQ